MLKNESFEDVSVRVVLVMYNNNNDDDDDERALKPIDLEYHIVSCPKSRFGSSSREIRSYARLLFVYCYGRTTSRNGNRSRVRVCDTHVIRKPFAAMRFTLGTRTNNNKKRV